jgi:hypothetical protein
MEDLTGFSDTQVAEEVGKICPQVLEMVGPDSEEYLSERLFSLEALSAPEEIVEFTSANEWVTQAANRNTQEGLETLASETVNSWIAANEVNLTIHSDSDFLIGKARAINQFRKTTVEQCEIAITLQAIVALEKRAIVVIKIMDTYLEAQKQLELKAAETQRKAAAAAAKASKQAEQRAREAEYSALFLPNAARHPDLRVEFFSCAGLGWGDTAARMKVSNTSDSEIVAYARVVWLNSRGEVLGQAGAEAAIFPGLVSNLDVPLPSEIRSYSDCKIAELTMLGEY